jgi:pSer/pThr/pTyr-binding forkhead associated (FHA) protein
VAESVVFLLRAVVLVLLWGFVAAAVVAVRHDVFGTRPRRGRDRRGGSSPQPTSPAPQRRSSTAPPTRLVVVEGQQAGMTVSLEAGTVTIGRATDSTLLLSDDYASNHHAEISASRGGVQLRDLDSTNGTYVDGKRVTGTTTVRPGQRIQIGQAVLEVRP